MQEGWSLGEEVEEGWSLSTKAWADWTWLLSSSRLVEQERQGGGEWREGVSSGRG